MLFLLVVPATARSQYNSDGIMFNSIGKEDGSFEITSTNIIPTTMIIPSINNSDIRNLNGTIIKRTIKKGLKKNKNSFLRKRFFFSIRNSYWNYCWYCSSSCRNNCWYTYFYSSQKVNFIFLKKKEV